MTERPRIVSALASESDAAAIAAFYREVWDPTASAESVLDADRLAATRNAAEPGRVPPRGLVFSGDRVVGYCGTIPQPLWDGKAARPAYWLKGLMVLPEFRNGPIGYMAVKALTSEVECSAILAVAPAARRLFSALGYADMGAVPNWVRPLRLSSIAAKVDVKKIAGAQLPNWLAAGVGIANDIGALRLVAGAGERLLDATTDALRITARGLETSEGAVPSDAELDQLWREARNGFAASPVRDAHYLRERFLGGKESSDPHASYSVVTTRHHGRLVGFGAIRHPRVIPDDRLGGIHMAVASELVFHPARSGVGVALIGGIARAARNAGADAVTSMTPHPRLSSLLRRQGYFRVTGNVHFLLRDVTGNASWPPDLSSWWLARGDGEADTSF